MKRALSKLFNRLKNGKTMDSILDAGSFNELLSQERARADRMNYSWVLITFELDMHNGSQAIASKLVSTTLSRIRVTDSIGWINDSIIGILLPGAKMDGVRKLLDEVMQKMPEGMHCPDGKVYRYPLNIFSPVTKRGEKFVEHSIQPNKNK